MSIIDKVIAAVTPPKSEERRLRARAKARVSAQGGLVERRAISLVLFIANGLYIISLEVEHVGGIVLWTVFAKSRCSI
jgi:hypothetical protein